MNLSQLTAFLESMAPLAYQEDYDNAGLIVGDPRREISKALLSLGCTEEVVEEAIAKGCELIIAHHPIVFRGLKKLTGKTYVERTVIKAIKHDIALYAIHTNLDHVSNGVKAKICAKLGLAQCRILLPYKIRNDSSMDFNSTMAITPTAILVNCMSVPTMIFSNMNTDKTAMLYNNIFEMECPIFRELICSPVLYAPPLS